jgi:hypothetical protein
MVDQPKLLKENPFGYVGLIAEMTSMPASGQCMNIEQFDGSNHSLGSITPCL